MEPDTLMSHPNPTEIHLHKQSRVLEISFDDGSKFSYPAEYLRVFSPSAEAELNFRTVGPGADVLESLAPLRTRVTIEEVLEVPPVRLHTVPGFDSAVFAFTTDIPLLPTWGRPLLFGPGSITVAHTDEESVEIRELEEAASAYVRLVKAILADRT